MPAPRSIDRDTFLTYLRQSGLVSDAELKEIAQQHAAQTRGRMVARALVEQGILTRFQAERLLVGRTSGFLLGQYRILDQVGRGGMGRVYKAQHRTMRRIVALKVLAADLLQTERAVELFLHEVRAVAHLVHPNIVSAYDANEIHGRYYLVLEFVDGPNLDQLVRKEGPLPVGLACDYVRQVAKGLHFAHQLGMVHRDIKPANILVQRRGANEADAPGLIKISDFGLARLGYQAATVDGPPATILTKDNAIMGTPDYLSPEQSRSLHRTDIRSDLYSLGCTFYFLLTGSVPFPGGNALDKMIRHATETAAPITSFRNDVPADVIAIVECLMAKNAEERYQTPADLAAVLEPWAVRGPTPWPVPPPSTPLLDNPAGGSENEINLEGASDVQLPAMVATVTNDQSPTPRIPLPPRQTAIAGGTDVESLKIAVLAALTVVGLAGLAVVALALMIR